MKTMLLNCSKKLIKSNLIILVFFLCTGISIAQISVSGKVTDAVTGEPLPGANIIIKGSVKGAQTDFDGGFSLETKSKNPILVVSYVGFTTQEIVLMAKQRSQLY